MIEKISAYIKEKKLFEPGHRVLVALSGGADSIALLRILLQMNYPCEAAHCNFNLRGEESHRDELFVRNLCAKCNIPLHIQSFDTHSYAAEHHLSIEMAARELRYTWFEQLRKNIGATCIAVAHHRDDSVETLLLNLIRGTGINGLTGIKPRNGYIVRPLLTVSRDELLAYLASIGQNYVTDSTNLEDEYTRNKIRLNILPLMEEINPSAKKSIAETASRLADAATIYNQSVQDALRQISDEQGINIRQLLSHPAPATLLFEYLHPLGFNARQVDDVYRSLGGQPGKVFYSKAWRVIKDRDYLLVTSRHDAVTQQEEGRTIEIDRGEECCFGEDGLLKITPCSCMPDFKKPANPFEVFVDAAKLSFPLIVRRWRTGDSFIPFGMNGKKKVSDYLTDKKYSLARKENIYVLCSGSDIVWVIGERLDNRFRVDKDSREIMALSVTFKRCSSTQ